MNKSIIQILLLCAPLIAIGQDWGNYSSFYSKGDIPSDFTDDYTQKFEKMRENISDEANRSDKQSEEYFYKRSEYYINDFLISGNVIFGDTISQYCSVLLDQLLVDNPELRKKIRVYTVKSPDFNAYATESGIIFVNAGLLAEIENEAQLSFILAHEVIHFEESHVLSEYVEKSKMDTEKMYRQEDLDTKLRSLSNYSKSQELEADKYGFDRYYNHMGYADIEAVYLMDIMQYSYLPFDEIPFEYSYLETSTFKISEDHKLDIINEISSDDDYDDSMSSHPNIQSRRDSIEDVVGSKAGKQFIVSKDWFDHCQRLARYETCQMNLVRRDYPGAIYTAFLLSEKYGEDKFQREIVAKALQGASVYRNENMLSDVIIDSDNIEGESQRVYHLMSEFKKKELNTLAVTYAYQVYLDYPDDKDIKYAYQHALHDLVFENRMELEDYGLRSYSNYQKAKEILATKEEQVVQDSLRANLPDSLATATAEEVKDTRARSSKISKIREKQTAIFDQPEDSTGTSTKAFDPEKLYLRAFLPYQTDSTFLSDFEDYENNYNTSDNPYNKGTSTSGLSRFEDPTFLGLDTMLILNPVYVNLDERADDGVKFVRSFDRQQNYNEIIDKIALKIGLDLHRIDFKELEASETEIFNDLCVLKNWLEERLDHENTGARMSNFDEVERIRDKYGINYISYTGNVSLREKSGGKTGLIVASILFPPLLMISLPVLLTSSYSSYNFFYVFDLKTGNALMAEYNYYPNADKDVYLKSITYNNLIQVKQ